MKDACAILCLMKRLAGLFLFISVLVGFSATVFAQHVSPSYQVEETQFGAGGELDASSPSYKAQSSLGSLGVDPTTGTLYKAYSGFLTPNEPFLEMTVTTSLVNLGTLDTATAKTGTANFSVRAYTNSGYTVTTVSSPPTAAGGFTLSPMTSQGASAAGTEQFGINLRANTSPATFGADPSPQPDSSFADGQAATGYSTVNQYKYNTGDVIANSNTSGWGLTIFTISYIANINSITEAGSYSMDHDLVVIPVY